MEYIFKRDPHSIDNQTSYNTGFLKYKNVFFRQKQAAFVDYFFLIIQNVL